MKNKFDYIVIGSGLAGLTTALTLEDLGNVAIFTKKNPADSATNLAQGGMAAMNGKGDRADWHVKDTLKAGDYHNKKKAVSFLVKNSREALFWLKAQGVLFDTAPSLEAGHRLPRIFHTTDFTGQDIEKTLLKKISKNKNINVFKNSLAIDLIIKKDTCDGVFVLTEENKIIPFFAKAIILATGGSGQVYQWTTNPFVTTGDGVAMASRVGADLSGLEFVQFHPTALKYKISPLFLLSERLRGEGAKLIDEKGNRFISELILRDELSRVIYEKQKSSTVYLTMAHLDKKEIIKKFPNIYKKLKTYGFDLTKDRIPITPAAHYQCGGVTTDLHGRTSIKNLFAVGEVASTGVHGANRLSSNSLLEAVVFGKQVGKYVNKSQKSIRQLADKSQKIELKNKEIKIIFSQKNIKLLNKIETDLKKTMWEKVGIVRRKKELLEALNYFESFKKRINKINIINNLKVNETLEIKEDSKTLRKLLEIANLIELAVIITKAALARPKSLGAHYIEHKANTTASVVRG
jgi:L-aspartate oxidase